MQISKPACNSVKYGTTRLLLAGRLCALADCVSECSNEWGQLKNLKIHCHVGVHLTEVWRFANNKGQRLHLLREVTVLKMRKLCYSHITVCCLQSFVSRYSYKFGIMFVSWLFIRGRSTPGTLNRTLEPPSDCYAAVLEGRGSAKVGVHYNRQCSGSGSGSASKWKVRSGSAKNDADPQHWFSVCFLSFKFDS